MRFSFPSHKFAFDFSADNRKVFRRILLLNNSNLSIKRSEQFLLQRFFVLKQLNDTPILCNVTNAINYNDKNVIELYCRNIHARSLSPSAFLHRKDAEQRKKSRLVVRWTQIRKFNWRLNSKRFRRSSRNKKYDLIRVFYENCKNYIHSKSIILLQEKYYLSTRLFANYIRPVIGHNPLQYDKIPLILANVFKVIIIR